MSPTYGAGGTSSSPLLRRRYREILVFLPDADGAGTSAPIATARALTDALGVGYAEFGVDSLTGAVELRLHYDPALYDAALAYLLGAGVVFEIDRR